MNIILCFVLLCAEPKLFSTRLSEKDAQIAELQERVAALTKQVETAQRELSYAKDDINAKSDRIAKLESRTFEITNLNAIQEEKSPHIQIRIITSPLCRPCHLLIENVSAYLKYCNRTNKSNLWVEDLTSSDAQIHQRILSQEDWQRLGYTLPRVELWVDDQFQLLEERDPAKLVEIYNAAVNKQREHLAGVSVGTIPAKQTVQQFLQLMEPFLDGGTLQLIYTPKAGVIKEYLTIKQGKFAVMIPPKTTISLTMKSGDMSIIFSDPKPRVSAIGMSRQLNEIDLTPNKVSLRLPYMMDPELTFTER